jgi:glycosyltransferase involved in cell wall biosynthesis
VRVLVATVVHRPDDARIRQREIEALLAAGDDVVYLAPFSGWGVTPTVHERLRTVDVPRAAGRRRARAVLSASRAMAREARSADLVLVHDPELVPALVRLPSGPGDAARVWDVHEDTAAALTLKSWLPARTRPLAAGGVVRLERWAEDRVHLLLAEEGYRGRFRLEHPVVPNSTPVPAVVPPPDQPRAIYVGHVTRARGGLDLASMAQVLRRRGSGATVEVVGHADGETAAALHAAQEAGDLRWHGFLPNAEALALVSGSMAGLSLLHDEPNYRHSRPTKVIEYMAQGVPVVTTPTPPARALVEGAACGILVPFGAPEAAADAVIGLERDDELRRTTGAAGHAAALADHDWNRDREQFVRVLHGWAGR